MIYFVVKSTNTYPLIAFKNSWGKALKKRATSLSYAKLIRQKKLHPGTYIFTGFDLLNSGQIKALQPIYATMKKHPDKFRLLNDPATSLSRIDFLTLLWEKGINSFRIFNATEIPQNVRFPVFVRKGTGHEGKLTGLISDQHQLGTIIENTQEEGFKDREILITEFVDTADESGVYRKYSAFAIEGQIIPRHIFFSNQWMIKGANLAKDKMIAEELNYIQKNPHAKQLKQLFALANIQYGRIDYSLKDNKIVVWEINPTPMIASSSSLKKSKRKPVHVLFSKDFVRELLKTDTTTSKKLIINPQQQLPQHKYTSIKSLFPYSKTQNSRINCYYILKSIILFYFYTLRNTLINNR